MFPAPSRRDFLQIVLGSAAGLSLSSSVFAQTHHTGLTSTRISDSISFVSGAGGNVVVVSSPDGLLMINGGSESRATELLTLVGDEWHGAQVQTLFNTDWHAEHTGCNAVLGKAGTRIIAHENTKQYLGAELYVEWQKRTYKPLPAYALPKQTFYTTGKMTFGTERIEYGQVGQAHTDGDIYLFFPDSNLLVAGDLLSVGKYPIPDYTSGGWIGGFVTAAKMMIDLTNAETRIVPGSGVLQTRSDLQAEHDMLAAVRERLIKLVRQGMGLDDIIAAQPTKDFDAKWGDPELFLRTTWRGMMLHVRELGGIV